MCFTFPLPEPDVKRVFFLTCCYYGKVLNIHYNLSQNLIYCLILNINGNIILVIVEFISIAHLIHNMELTFHTVLVYIFCKNHINWLSLKCSYVSTITAFLQKLRTVPNQPQKTLVPDFSLIWLYFCKKKNIIFSSCEALQIFHISLYWIPLSCFNYVIGTSVRRSSGRRSGGRLLAMT